MIYVGTVWSFIKLIFYEWTVLTVYNIPILHWFSISKMDRNWLKWLKIPIWMKWILRSHTYVYYVYVYISFPIITMDFIPLKRYANISNLSAWSLASGLWSSLPEKRAHRPGPGKMLWSTNDWQWWFCMLYKQTHDGFTSCQNHDLYNKLWCTLQQTNADGKEQKKHRNLGTTVLQMVDVHWFSANLCELTLGNQ